MSENGHGNREHLRAAILAQSGVLEERPMTMPTADGAELVLVRELTGKQSHDFEKLLAAGMEHPVGTLLQWVLIDPEAKERIFEVADRGALEELGMGGLAPILKAAMEMSGLTQEDIKKAKKDLATAPSVG